MSSQDHADQRHSHTALPARPDLIRLCLGIIGIGMSGPLVALSGMPVATLIFWRNLGGSLFTIPFALRHKEFRNSPGIRWAMASGVILAVHFVGFFLAMRWTTVAAGTALVASQPIFTAIYVKFAGGHIPSKAWLGMFISFIGVALVAGIDLTLSLQSFYGDMAALIAGSLSALYMYVGAKAQRELETSTYTAVCYFFCAMAALPMVFFTGARLFHFTLREWLLVLALIFGAQFLGHTMFNSVLKRVSPAVVSLIVFFEVPVGSILALWWLHQRPPLGIIPGIALILIGCAMVVVRTRDTSSND